ncbi:MAG TPA: serine hydrolase [Thermoanaerobaculia bacterium]|nr:serine hydrolase [Thermoanaerobaculia bacterium]
MRIASSLLALLLLSSCATAPRAGTDAELRDIDRFVTHTLQTLPELPSVGLAIVRDGKVYARGYGYADVEKRVLATADTGYYNGSNTKAYTAVLCTMLAEEGLLDLEAPVTKYLPELRFAPPLDASQLTLRRFLSHTSGVDNPAITYRTAFSGEHTPQQLVQILSMSKPGKPGFRYDNLGYVVASLVIERVTGRKWQDVLAQRVFKPLGMSRTTTAMSEARKHPIATPYDMNEAGTMARQEYGWKDDSTMHAAGGIVTTPNDLAKWLNANLTEGRVGARQVIPAHAFAETHRQQTPAKRDSFLFDGTGYGFAWYQSDLHGEPLIYHGGGYEGWRSVYSFLPAKKMAVGAMTNAGLSHSPLELISAYAYDRLMHVPNVDATYEEKLAQVRARFDTVKKNRIDEVAKRAQRTWTLTKPLSAYTGQYESVAYGTMTITQRGDKLIASIGRLSGELQPFTDPDSARVELVPGTGEVLQFRFANGASTPDALKWNDEVLPRK